MNIDINTILITVMAIISGASIILKAIAPLTKTLKDDKAVVILDKILKVLSLHTKQKDNKLDINVKR